MGKGIGEEEKSKLLSVPIIIMDLGNSPYLGISFDDHIVIDNDAAGWGWSFADDEQLADNLSVDLLDVLVHEFGHQLGFADQHDAVFANDVMYWELETQRPQMQLSGEQPLRPIESPTPAIRDWHDQSLMMYLNEIDNPNRAYEHAGKRRQIYR